MKTTALMVTTTCALIAMSVSSQAADRTSWKTIIGIAQAGNVVDGIAGGGQPWSTLGGEASVDLRGGDVEFEVKGLVLAGGDTIGTPAGITSVAGTIVCGPGVSVSTPQVPLSAQGDAKFEGTVFLPSSCTSSNINFLLTIPAGRWIANGAVRRP
jgi:hypothetical protein